MNLVSEDVANILAAEAPLNLTGGDNLFISEWGKDDEGKDVDAQVMLMDKDGLQPTQKDIYEQPFFKLYVRGDKAEGSIALHARARAIHEFLIEFETTIEYNQFHPMGTLNPIGRDDNDRFIFTADYYTFRDPS